MPRSLLTLTLLLVAISVVACSGTQKTPATPPEKTTDMEPMGGTTTTDVPEMVAEAEETPTRPMTVDEYVDETMKRREAAGGRLVEEVPIPAAEPVPGEPVPAEAPVESVPPEVPIVETMAEKRLREVEEKTRIEREYTDYLVGYYIGQARALYDDLEYGQAEEMILKALERAPDNSEAIEVHRMVQAALGKRAGEIPDARRALVEIHQVKSQEALTKGNYYFNRGKKAFHEERFAAAISDFENVLTIISRSPYGVDWGTLKEDAEQFLFEANQKKEQQDAMLAREAARAALGEVDAAESKRKREADERVAKLLQEGLEEFENERFDVAENLSEQVLALDPMNARARALLEEAVRARHRKTSDSLLQVQKDRFREWRLDIQKTTVPWSERPLQWPSQQEWDRINKRARAVTDFGASVDLDPEDQVLKNRLKSETVNFTFDGATLPQALEFIRTLKNVNIVIDGKVMADLEEAPVTLSVTDLELESALELLLRLAGPDFTYILKQGVVFVTNKEGAAGKPVLRVHSVGDLTIRLTNFIAPNLILKPAGAEIDESQPLFGRAEEGAQLLGGGPEELMDLITQNIDPEGWEGELYKINVSGTDKLVVLHTPEIQGEIARFLDDLRRFAGLVVTIEARFLTVNDEFLQDVGVDIRGLGGDGRGPIANLDDVTNGLEDGASAGLDNNSPGLPVASGGNPSSGAFFNNNSDGDYRGRNENLFDAALGTVLSATGGAIIQYTFLDDTDVNLILKAVEKTQSGRLLQAPSLTVYNTQRANITLVNQLSFIQDFDVEVAQTAFIADPIIGIIQDGLTLDVRPTISHDRKYVTLELQPTIATLLRPIPTFQTSLGALTTPVTIQLPELRIEKSQTTVRVPDGGSLVIGGLKHISLVDMKSEVPWLGEIPIISFFFSRKASSKEAQNLMPTSSRRKPGSVRPTSGS